MRRRSGDGGLILGRPWRCKIAEGRCSVPKRRHEPNLCAPQVFPPRPKLVGLLFTQVSPLSTGLTKELNVPEAPYLDQVIASGTCEPLHGSMRGLLWISAGCSGLLLRGSDERAGERGRCPGDCVAANSVTIEDVRAPCPIV